MTPDRLDDLLERALASGEVPADASPEERAEIESLLAARADLRTLRDAVADEAAAAMAPARARFQRYRAAQTTPPVEVRTLNARQPLLTRLFAGRRLQLSASLAALLLVAAIAVVATRGFGGPQQVQALGVDDYVQLSGVVTETDNDTVRVDSPDLGPITVSAAGVAFLDEQGAVLERPPRPGDHLVIAGVVRDARKGHIAVEGQALALAGAAVPGANGRPFDRLRQLPDVPEGTITLVAIDRDARTGRAILVLADGRRALVEVDVDSLGQIIVDGPPIGSRVRLGHREGHPFSLEPIHGHDDGQHESDRDGRPGIVRLSGVIRDVGPGTFTLETADGPVTVVHHRRLRILPGESGLSRADIRRGASLEGYTATVAGGHDPATGAFVAGLLVLGPKP
jgi:hypothetical protein